MRDSLDSEALHAALVTPGGRWTGVEVHPTLGSTNAEVVRLGRLGHVVVADHQQAGRGRLGRSWETAGGTSVTMSVLVDAPDTGRGWVPLFTGLAVLRGIADLTGLRAGLKWPNDVLLPADDERKVCGVLCELQPAGVVVGIGINVDQSREELPVDTATSLRLAGAENVRREDLIAAVLSRLAELHEDLLAGGERRLAGEAAYREECLTIGREVDLHLSAGEVRRARAVGIDREGRLVVDGGSGEYAVAAGDVTHVRAAD